MSSDGFWKLEEYHDRQHIGGNPGIQRLLLHNTRNNDRSAIAHLRFGPEEVTMNTSASLTCIAILMSVLPSASGESPGRAAKVEVVIGGLMTAEGGEWSPESSPLKRPFGVDFNSRGQMFIVELEGGRIHRHDPDGSLHHVSGDGSKSYRGDGGNYSQATFNGMHNCAVTPNGDLYIADSWNHCVRHVDAQTGLITTIAGTGKAGFNGDGGPASSAQFDYIMCITLNPAGNVLHITDLKNRRIRAVDLRTGIVRTVAGNGRRGVPEDGSVAVDSPLVDPRAVAADSQGNIYVLERGGNALRVVRSDGTIETVAGSGKNGLNDGAARQCGFGSPKHVCVDNNDNVYIADDTNKAIRKYDPKEGTVTTILGRGHGDKRIQLLHPHGVCWQNGNLYVVDTGHNRILRMSW